jgi:hypothetical protein
MSITISTNMEKIILCIKKNLNFEVIELYVIIIIKPTLTRTHYTLHIYTQNDFRN